MHWTKATIILAVLVGLAVASLAIAVLNPSPPPGSEDRAAGENSARPIAERQAGLGDKKRVPEVTPELHALVQGNGAFAFDLYARLSAEEGGKNLFFSPYSISSALALVAEGARGETAAEMGKALHYPDFTHRHGDDARVLPWDMSRIHEGMATLNDHFTGGSQSTPKEVRDRLTGLRQELAAVNRTVKELGAKNQYAEAQAATLKGQALAEQINALQTRHEQYEMRVANALWGEKTHAFKQSYLDALDRHYGSVFFAVDFRNDYEGARQRINGWVEKQTHERIKEMIPKGEIDEETQKRLRLILTNAIYFKGEWAEVFPAAETRDEDFALADGKKVRVPLMRHGAMPGVRYAAFKADGSFFETPREVPIEGGDPKALAPDETGFELLELPYKGGAVSMVLLLPRSADGLGALEKRLTATNLQTWVGNLQPRPVHVFVPRFKLRSAYTLERALRGMGMLRAFTDPGARDGAEFEGMSESAEPAQRVSLSRVLHKAFVEVNEKGTEAAAATVVSLAPPGPIEDTKPFTPTFRADRPFAFLIREVKTGSILFLGRVVRPE